MSGGRIRTLKPEILEDKVTAGLTSDEFRLFVGMILLADDYGNLRAEPAWLSGQIFWLAGLSRDPRECVARLADARLVELYLVDGQSYAHIRNWAKHQRVDRPGKPRVPRENEGIRETLATLSRDPRDTLATDQGPGPGPGPGPTEVSAGPPAEPAAEPDPWGLGPPPSAPASELALPGLEGGKNASEPVPGYPGKGESSKASPEGKRKPKPPSPAKDNADAVREVWEHFLARRGEKKPGGHVPLLTAKRKAHIGQRIAESGIATVKQAIDGLWKSEFHVGGGWTDPEHVFRSAEQLEKMLGIGGSPSAMRPRKAGNGMPFIQAGSNPWRPYTAEEAAQVQREIDAMPPECFDNEVADW